MLTSILLLLAALSPNSYALNVNNETLVEKRESRFPIPQIVNVYEEWKPVNPGHPLRDETFLYAPPSLERVIFRSPQRSLEDVGTGRSAGSDFGTPTAPIVISATVSSPKDKAGYSVYGSPHINYSKFYSNPPAKVPSFSSNKRSDEFEGRSQEHRSQRRINSHGGGFQYIDPPNKADNEYYYYSDDSPYYKARLSIHPSSLKAKSDRDDTKESQPLVFDNHNFDRQSRSKAVVYTFHQRDNGQKRKIGVVYNEDNFGRLQGNNILGSQKENSRSYRRESLNTKTVSDNQTPPTLPPRVEERSHAEIVSGQLNHVYHGLKYHKVVTPPKISYPLGAPFGVPTNRPKYFPPQKRPPIFKVRPTKLEGVFGPPIPTLPAPVYDQSYEDQRKSKIVYKTVRDMEYTRPNVILRVKDSGELYTPTSTTMTTTTTTMKTTTKPPKKKLPRKISPKTPKDLYNLCLVEVPNYLHDALCSPILEESSSARITSTTTENPELSVITRRTRVKVYGRRKKKVKPVTTTTTTQSPIKQNRVKDSTELPTSTTSTEIVKPSKLFQRSKTSSRNNFLSRLSQIFFSEKLVPTTESSEKIESTSSESS